MEQTKGYLTLKGEVYNLEKDVYENSSSRIQTLVVKTSENNRIRVSLGKWKNSPLNVKMKCEGMDKPVEINEQESIEEIKASFNEGDTVVINCRSEANTYKDGSLDFYLNSIYISDKKIDFSAKNFEEISELKTSVIIAGKIKDGIQDVILCNYKGELLCKEFIVNDKDIIDYLADNADVGDVLNVFVNVKHEPIFGESKEKENEERTKKTLKSRDSDNKTRIIGNKEIFEIIDIDLEKIEKGKYNLEELGLNDNSSQSEDMPF